MTDHLTADNVRVRASRASLLLALATELLDLSLAEPKSSAGRRGKLVLRLENVVSPLRDAGASVTVEPDRPAAPKP